MTRTRVAIHGAAGRMGQRLVAIGLGDPDLEIVGALEAAGHNKLGQDAGQVAGVGPLGVRLTSELESPADVMIDFSVPSGTMAVLEICLAKSLPLVIATTGFSDEQRQRIREATAKIPVLWSPSMSLAVNLAMRLAGSAAEALRSHTSGVDVEILERHHRFKEDAPSGTALKFGEIIAGKMGQTEARHGREGRLGVRPRGEIGYHAVRTGDNPGEHTIVFGLIGETLEITVRASNRDCYAHGALAAAKFLARQKPGLYGMENVLGG